MKSHHFAAVLLTSMLVGIVFSYLMDREVPPPPPPVVEECCCE